MPLGANVRKFRENRKWNQATLAAKAEVDIGTISALEVRDSAMSKYASALAAGFGVTLEQLFNGDDPADPNKKKGGPAEPTRQPPVPGTLSALAIDVARRWEALSDERREWFRDLIFTVSYVEERFPEMRKGAPRGANYPSWEVHTKAAFDQLPLFTDLPKPKKAAKGA